LALKAASAPDATPAFALRAVPLPVEAYPPPADEGCAPEAEVAAGGVNVDEAARPQAAVAARPQAAVAARPQASVAAETPCAAAAHVSAAAPDAAAAAPSADGAAALAATDGMGAAEGAEGVAAVAAATRTGRKPRKRNNNGGGETARAGAADGASAEGSLAEWQALHEGLVTCVRERLDALVVSSAERERVHCAEHRAIKQVVEKQLRSANHLEEVRALARSRRARAATCRPHSEGALAPTLAPTVPPSPTLPARAARTGFARTGRPNHTRGLPLLARVHRHATRTAAPHNARRARRERCCRASD
jgi:hypothetical protein